MTILIIGGGAAGFFSAVNIAEFNPGAEITIVEKNPVPLAKVRISGGGRCNVTNNSPDLNELIKFYPRGSKELFGLFHHFSPINTMEWFRNHNVPLKTESDNRVFPESNSSQTIIDCFLNLAQKRNIRILYNHKVTDISRNNKGWQVDIRGKEALASDHIIITSGGGSDLYDILKKLGHTIIPPVPSLFTFQIKNDSLKKLSGVSLRNVELSIPGTKFSASGDILITHTGLSGPVVLKLSAFAARYLNETDYKSLLLVNWTGSQKPTQVSQHFESLRSNKIKTHIINSPQLGIPSRLWEYLISCLDEVKTKRFFELSNKDIAKLTGQLTQFPVDITGQNRFKEEFVTCGGVKLKEVNFKTMESKIHKGLFFAGEILDIDGLTGGFNFQSAWSTAYTAAVAVGSLR